MLRLPTLTLAALLFSAASVKSQLTISAGSTFTIQSAGIVTVEGDITGSADITGAGKIVLSGNTAAQNVNMNGFTISNLEMDNGFNANLTGNTRIGTSLLFTVGKINAGNFNLNLAPATISTGMGISKFVETNGTGQVLQELTANVIASVVPVGAGTVYRPAFITSTGTYSSASVGVRALAVADPNRPPSLSDYVTAYWPVTKTGVTGTVSLGGQYDNADIVGTEAFLRGYFFNATDWSSAGQVNDAATNRITAPVTTATGEISGFDKFSLVKTKAFLQGAYVSGGLMSENLRTAPNLIPLTDPYRTAPYTTSFAHVANANTETVVGTVITAPAVGLADNIVDWVFLQLRDNTTGTTILQTRSALLQRDGDIVDVDGISPVTFNNVVDGNYTIAVRHRNHLGLSTDPATFNPALGETKSTAVLVDLSVATDAQLFGPTAAYTVSVDGRNLLWGGNATAVVAQVSNYSGPNNDKDYILATGLGGNSTATVTEYNKSDLNLTRTVRFSGPGNDKDFLLSNVLGGLSTVTRTQSLP